MRRTGRTVPCRSRRSRSVRRRTRKRDRHLSKHQRQLFFSRSHIRISGSLMAEAVLPPDAAAFLREHLGDGWSAHALAGDASVRAYYRISSPDGSTYMLAYYPDEVRPQLQRFLDAYRAVSPHGPLPALLYHGEAAALQEDVGDRTVFDILHT